VWRESALVEDSSVEDVFLLGAGASMDAGLPSSYGLTADLSRATALPERGKKGGSKELATALAFAIGTLYQQRGAAGINPLHKPAIDIEELIDAVEALAHPESSGMTPFISGFHPYLRDLDAASDDRAQFVDQLIDHLQRLPELSGAAATETKELAAASLKLALLLNQPRHTAVLFRRLKAAIVRRVSQILWIDQRNFSGVDYLRPLMTCPSVCSIATLNYDNCLEVIAETCNVALDFGLSRYESEAEVRFDHPSSRRVIKLHGSMDWSLKDPTGTDRKFPGAECLRFRWQRVEPTSDSWNVDDLGIVFGRFKMQSAGPFLQLLQSFSKELSDASRLVTVGYSYRDGHVNRAISTFMRRNAIGRLLIVDPTMPDPYDPLVALRQLFGKRVQIWNATAAEALSTYPDGPRWGEPANESR
jgi:hypothetical protein